METNHSAQISSLQHELEDMEELREDAHLGFWSSNSLFPEGLWGRGVYITSRQKWHQTMIFHMFYHNSMISNWKNYEIISGVVNYNHTESNPFFVMRGLNWARKLNLYGQTCDIASIPKLHRNAIVVRLLSSYLFQLCSRMNKMVGHILASHHPSISADQWLNTQWWTSLYAASKYFMM